MCLGGSMFWWVHWSNYNRKKGTVVWLSVGMFGGSMVPRSNYDRKKGTVVWPSVAMLGGFHELILFWRVCCYVLWQVPWSNYKLRPEKKVSLSGHRLECLLRTFDSFWMGVVPPASSLLSKSIRKVSITATCRLEWHYQLSKKIMAFSLSNIEIQWFFFHLKPTSCVWKIGLNSWLKFKLESFLWINLQLKSE